MSDRFLSGVVEQLGLDSYSMLALYAFIFVAIRRGEGFPVRSGVMI